MIQLGKILAPDDWRLLKYADGLLGGLEGWQAYLRAFPKCRSKKKSMAGHQVAKERADVKLYMEFSVQAGRDSVAFEGLTQRLFLVRLILKAAEAIEANDSKGINPGLLEFFRRTLAESEKSCRDISAGTLKSTIRELAKICPIPIHKFIE